MMMPSVFGRDIFDDFMDGFAFPDVSKELYGKHAKNVMKTDVRELTISAAKGLDKDETDKKGNYIRQERYTGSMSRSFYVGDGISEDDIHGKFENGILQLDVPKKEVKAVETKKRISIEG